MSVESIQQLWKEIREGSDCEKIQKKFLDEVVRILTGEEDIELFGIVQELREERGNVLHIRGAVHVSSYCRVNCQCCPMRRDNLHHLRAQDMVMRSPLETIIADVQKALNFGCQEIFMQGGEDPQVVPSVGSAIQRLKEGGECEDIFFNINLGNLPSTQYKKLKDQGAGGYVLKFETSNPALHQALRGTPIEERLSAIERARQAGLQIGSGTIVGIPSQTQQDIARDYLFIGKHSLSYAIHHSPYSPSEWLLGDWSRHTTATLAEMKRIVALSRILFPESYIHAPSNMNEERFIGSTTGRYHGQIELLKAGANEISLEFVNPEMRQRYHLYVPSSERSQTLSDFLEEVVTKTQMTPDLKQ